MTTIKGNVVDFEFFGKPGNPPVPICFVANNLETNETIKQWVLDDYPDKPPYETSAENLFIAYSSSAELFCHLALNWVFPRNILDLFIEFKNMANGHIGLSQFKSLISVASYYGIDGASTTYKDKMRTRILQGPPYSDKEKEEILDYCELDVIITKKVFQKMLPLIDWPRAQLRGRYMAAVAIMERNGIPIDTNLYTSIINHWDEIKLQMIAEVNPQYNVYEGTIFKMEDFEKYLNNHNIYWERTSTGRLKLTDEIFKSYSTTYPQLEMLRQLRYNLNQLKLHKLEIGDDERNRTSLHPFGTKTSRNAPSSTTYIFGPAVWIRHLIKPKPGKALAYIDYKQQEVGIGAALSKDKQLSTDYLSGDPYIAFGKAAYLLPPDATKDTHPEDREKFKTCFLATNYGMGVESFAKKANITISMAAKLLRYHKKIYKVYWEWSDRIVDEGLLTGQLLTCYGWRLLTKYQTVATLRNFPMQAHGAEILRIACGLVLDAGIKVCAPIHDALLIESDASDIEEAIKTTQSLMADVGEIVLDGFSLGTDATIIRYQERFSDKRGAKMWQIVTDALGKCTKN